MTGFCGCPAQVRPTLIGVHPPGRNACPGRSSIFSRVPPLRGKVCGEGGEGFRLVAYLRGDARQSSAPIIPGDPNLPRGSPLGVCVYGWGVLQVGHILARGRPAIISTHHPRGPKFFQGVPPKGGGIWGLVSSSPSPCVGVPEHSGGSCAAASAETNPPLFPRTEFLLIHADDPHIPSPLRAYAR